MPGRFAGKTAVVTGGGTGIGRGAALAFAAEGANVVILGPDAQPLTETVEVIKERGGHGDRVIGDVTHRADLQQMITTATGRYGGLDIAFNNAGVMVAGRIAELDEQSWALAMSVATGTWLSMKCEISYMRNHGGGVIVNMCSIIGAHRAIAGTGAYGAAKAAIRAMSRTAAIEHIADGIRINSVSPGPVATPLSLLRDETQEQQVARMRTTLPIGRVGTIEEVAATVLWLASAESGFAVGSDIVIDGGATA